MENPTQKIKTWIWTHLKLTIFAVLLIIGGIVGFIESRDTERYRENPQAGDIVYYVSEEGTQTPITALKIIKVDDTGIFFIPCKYEYNKVSVAQKAIKKAGEAQSFVETELRVLQHDEFKNLKIKNIHRP